MAYLSFFFMGHAIICLMQVEQNLHDETPEDWAQGSEVETWMSGMEELGAAARTEQKCQGTGASQLPISRVPTRNNNHLSVTSEVFTCSHWDVPQFFSRFVFFSILPAIPNQQRSSCCSADGTAARSVLEASCNMPSKSAVALRVCKS